MDELQSLFTVKKSSQSSKAELGNKKFISLNRHVNKLFPFEVADEKKEEVTTFIDQECGPVRNAGGV